MSETFLIRDFFNAEIATTVANKIKSLYSSFDQEGFLSFIIAPLLEQTYTERKETFTTALIRFLPDDYPTAVDIIIKSLPPEYQSDQLEATSNRFYISAFTGFISKQGLDHFDLSMEALYKMTKCFTAEWDIRPFILLDSIKSFALLTKWSNDNNPHIRRLVSEGSRPNLPWGKKLKFVDEDPSGTTLPLLAKLQNDPVEYVRRSVANHLNDLAKNNADLVVKYLSDWKKQNYTKDKERMINHALRTLIKNGHKGALALIGYDDDFDISLAFTKHDTTVAWGEKYEFEFTIKNNRPFEKPLIIDYILGFQKKDGSVKPKVFKLKKIILKDNETLKIQKSQSFKEISTRTYYPGKHQVSIQVNGKTLGTIEFDLLEK